jgi:hypothetical protein
MSGNTLRSAFRFNKIWVIESLPENEKQTGTILYNDLLSRKSFQFPQLHTEIVKIETLAELVALLQQIKDDVYGKAHLPFLHFEIHGSKAGLVLTSLESITWAELAGLIRPINIDTRNNVMVTTAVCWGGVAFTEIDPTMPSPFAGIIGPFAKVYVPDIEAGFYEFFDVLLSAGGFDAAVEALNQHGEERFNFIPSIFLFKVLWDKIIESYDNPVELKERIDNLTLQVASQPDNTRTVQELENYFRDYFTNHRDEMKDELLDDFLMRKMAPLAYRDVDRNNL